MKKLSAENIDFHMKMRFIGYYMSQDQVMRSETIFPEQAEQLASLLQKTFETIYRNKYIDKDMKAVFKGNTVFILKGEDGRLYGYYPQYNIARLTGVHYVKSDVTPMPENYKRWFYPGNKLLLYRKENDNGANKSTEEHLSPYHTDNEQIDN